MERLQKYLARAGMASRREAEKMISAGRVQVNGSIVREMGLQIEPGVDRICLDGREVRLTEDKVYILMNKPGQVVTTLFDPQQRKKVTDLLRDVAERVYPVGRLDYETEGLLLLTNDGELAYRLTHPKHKVEKTYLAVVKGNVSEKALGELRNGVLLDDGPTKPAEVVRVTAGKQTELKITIHEGRNRQIRRMCEAVGYPVIYLCRIAFGPLELGDLGTGRYRHLSSGEVKLLKEACGYPDSCQ